jgi:hypothetical protein
MDYFVEEPVIGRAPCATRWLLAMTKESRVCLVLGTVLRHFVTFCDALRSNFKFWNESGTNRVRIADSSALRLRSPQHLALTPDGGTRSSLAKRDKGGVFVEFLKFAATSESNQK